MAAEARNNDSADLKLSCAAERLVEAAIAAKPLPRYLQAPTAQWTMKCENFKRDTN